MLIEFPPPYSQPDPFTDLVVFTKLYIFLILAFIFWGLHRFIPQEGGWYMGAAGLALSNQMVGPLLRTSC
jgi:hypothetical protein